MLDLLAGRRRVGAVVPNTGLGAANAVVIFTRSTFASMVGNKTLKIKRLKIQSLGVGADTWVHIGTGVAGAFVDAIPALRLVNNTTDDYAEGDLPQVELNANITAYPDAGAAGTVNVQVEVEEIG
jgi:hypothetical protein